MRRLSSLWGIGAMLVVSLTMALVDAQGCTGNDANGCELFKYIQCGDPDTAIDVGFLLDASESMTWGITCSSTLCAEDCPVTLAPGLNSFGGCRRSDIMRIVLRMVMKRIFKKFSQGCYEYLESEQYLESQEPCRDTKLRSTIIWWSSDFVRSDEFQEFSKIGTDGWSTDLAEFLYVDLIDYERNTEHWEQINNEWKIKETAIDEYFDTTFYKGDGADFPKYPPGNGLTYPTTGIQKWKSLIKGGAKKYPTFLMTDGEVTGVDEFNNVGTESDKLRKIADNVATYGLGLTGSDSLKEAQTKLYDDSNWIYTTTVNGEEKEHFFSTQESADIVVEAILGRVTKGCKTCYSLEGYPDQCTLGNDIPIFPGFNDPEKNPVENQTVATMEQGCQVSQKQSEIANFVKFYGDDTVYKIKEGTVLCECYEEQSPSLKFTDFDSNGTCVCCKELNMILGDCLCDYTSTIPLLTTTELVGPNLVQRVVNQYSSNSALEAQLKANPEKFSSEETTNNDESDTGTGGGGTIIDPTTGLPIPNTTIPGSGVPGSGVNVAVSWSALLATAGCWALSW